MLGQRPLVPVPSNTLPGAGNRGDGSGCAVSYAAMLNRALLFGMGLGLIGVIVYGIVTA